MDIETIDLINQVKIGDDKAFERLADKYKNVTSSASRSFINSLKASIGSEADEFIGDINQEAHLALYRAALSYNSNINAEVTFGLYAKICIRNALISEMRKIKRSRRKIEKVKQNQKIALIEASGRDDSIGKTFDDYELEELIGKYGGILSDYEHAVLKEYIRGKSIKEISQSTGRTEKSVSNALYRVKVKIKGLSNN